ncbi:putative FUN14 domain-containing protein 1 [Apostichopus japonicus]|uniref:Putative FUN14 domain-containing protein 1 n=1 Tax=Stichopus japonicus TaxID=307972 RepID=A0A2G8JJK0_STIJA|nr:putative FUN14 domain-containing protein 1 [Apostichopus japonicus]
MENYLQNLFLFRLVSVHLVAGLRDILFQKVGKLAATAVGGGFFLILVGHQTGYLRIDWQRVERDVSKTQSRITREAEQRLPQVSGLFHQAKDLIKKNVILSGSFGAGFLLGVAM